MVSKCANPSCSVQLRYLREGRLFETRARVGDKCSVEYFWLCDDCSRYSIVVKQNGGPVLVPSTGQQVFIKRYSEPTQSIPFIISLGKDRRDVLEILNYELYYLEHGGYREQSAPHAKTASFFEDSITCMNYTCKEGREKCANCVLYGFIPSEYNNHTLACHFIPLNDRGDTLHSMALENKRQVEIEKTVAEWLRRTIKKQSGLRTITSEKIA